MTATTGNSAYSWSPDVVRDLPEERMPGLLILKAANVLANIEGDEPALRVGYIADDTASIVKENAEIAEAAPELLEAVVRTSKFATICGVSNELHGANANSVKSILASLFRSIERAANAAFLTLEGDEREFSPVGILTAEAGIPRAGEIVSDLDPYIRAVSEIEANGGTANLVLASPAAWADVSTLRAGEGFNSPLLSGDVASATTRALFGVPVVVDPAVPAGNLVVIDRNAIIAASGQVKSVMSAVAAPHFARDATAIRATYRCGWSVVRPNRCAVLTTESFGSPSTTADHPLGRDVLKAADSAIKRTK